MARRGCGVFHKRRGTCKRKRQAACRIDGRRAMSAGCHQLTVRASPAASARSARSAETALPPVSARTAIMEKTKHPFIGDSQVSIAMNSAERGRRGAVAQHDERRCGTMRATRFRRVALFAERPCGTGKKVKDREIDVAPWFCTGPCASKAANHWQATAPRRARGESEAPRRRFPQSELALQSHEQRRAVGHG